MHLLHPPTSTTRLAARRTLWAWRNQRDLTLCWVLAVTLLVGATVTPTSPASHALARWAILLALATTLLCMWRISRWAVSHLIYVVSLWQEDVPLGPPPPDGTNGKVVPLPAPRARPGLRQEQA